MAFKAAAWNGFIGVGVAAEGCAAGVEEKAPPKAGAGAGADVVAADAALNGFGLPEGAPKGLLGARAGTPATPPPPLGLVALKPGVEKPVDSSKRVNKRMPRVSTA